ncbi:MAG: S-layer family protein [Cyanobacteria bacterium J06635_15]
MKQVVSSRRRARWVAAGLVIGGGFAIAPPILAQIIPDDTMPTPSSVAPGCTSCTIEGGTLRGNNLFHSFTEFSVPIGDEVIFNNLDVVEHIFSRVTGSSVSDIDGLIQANGTANLFLLNPNGIIFGPNAQLDIGGSFVASTADAIQFGDQTVFSASNPATSSFLTIDPSAFFFTASSSGVIENQSIAPAGVDLLGNPLSGLRVQDGQSLMLIGRDISMPGGRINALGGQVTLASVTGPGSVDFNLENNNLSMDFPENLLGADILLSDESVVEVGNTSAGTVNLWGRNITLRQGSRVLANTRGVGSGGRIGLRASETVQLMGTSADGSFNSGLFATMAFGASPESPAGGLSIMANQLLIQGGAEISTTTFGEADGGTLTIEADSLVQVSGESDDGRFGSFVAAQSFGEGDAGELSIDTDRLAIQDGAQISVTTLNSGTGGILTVNATESIEVSGSVPGFSSGLFAQNLNGQPGKLSLLTRRLWLENGAQIGASTAGLGDGGTIVIDATEFIHLLGTSEDGIPSAIFTGALDNFTIVTGDSGDLVLNTRQLLLQGGAQVSAGSFTQGNAGNVLINASESIQLSGISQDGQRASGIFTQTSGAGDAGTLILNTEVLSVRDQALVSASTSGGTGGMITITANSLEVSEAAKILTTTFRTEDAGDINLRVADRIDLTGQDSGLLANTERESSGNGGSIFLNPTSVTLRDGAGISVNSQGTGIGGDILLVADALMLANNAFISAETVSNTGGNILLQLQDILLLRNSSFISTNAGIEQGLGDGGDIRIDVPIGFVIAVPQENSDVTANAFEGRGGNIDIVTQGIFGIEPRDELSSLSDITASSESGVSGVIQINNLNVDPSQGLVELPSGLLDSSQLLAQGCEQSAVDSASRGEFFNSGRGGIVSLSSAMLGSDDVVDDLRLPTGWPDQSPVTEAQGWFVSDAGDVVLASAPEIAQEGCWR